MTPIRPVLVAWAADRIPGSRTPTAGTGSAATRSSSATDGGGVAGHHDELGVERFYEIGADLERKRANLAGGTGPVGIAAGVADVDDVLAGQQVDQGPRHGQAAEATVEDADRASSGSPRLPAPAGEARGLHGLQPYRWSRAGGCA